MKRLKETTLLGIRTRENEFPIYEALNSFKTIIGQSMTPSEIKQARLALGLTQQQFAVKLGVTVSTVSRWESGISKPSPLAVKAIQSA